jgi:nitrogen fixation NifU-like protein
MPPSPDRPPPPDDAAGAAAAAASRSPAQLAALYQELILDHYRRPRNKGAVERPDAVGAARNPLCGDEVEVSVALDGDRVADARFTGRGCSISQAAASMMTGLVRGRTRAEVAALRRRVAELLAGDAAAAADPSLGDARALAGVATYPARHRCASMAWEAVEKALGRGTEG